MQQWWKLSFIGLSLLLISGCQSVGDKDTIARLRDRQIDITEVEIEGGLDKAMQSYQRFLEETPDTALAPEAIRRLADLKIEKEYGIVAPGDEPKGTVSDGITAPQSQPPQASSISDSGSANRPQNREAESDFETRATQSGPLPPSVAGSDQPPPGVDDLERAGALEALALYKRLLNDYPLYDRNDQVLYQMSRAYEELGRIDEAMQVMQRLVREFPGSRYIGEVQFRRAEYFFSHRKYLDAEDAYKSIVAIGKGSSYYELALYKLGWTFYKQELYEDAQHRFIALLDHKLSIGYDFEQTADETERKRTDDTFRVISLGFSNLGGADSVVDYFSRYGKRRYEDKVYSNLAEFYFDKRRYADASASYSAFVSRNPFHKMAPNFHMRIIDIHAAGGFPSLVLDSKKAFATTYGLKADYWNYFDPKERQDVLDNLKINLKDLANHYHASYQKPRKKIDKPVYFKEALHWYREYLASFPTESESSTINFQLADLLLQNRNFGLAAVEYEKTAYDYPSHAKASEAGYAAVYAYRKHLESSVPDKKRSIKREVVRSSMKFVDTFPKHEKADIVLGAAAEDLYAMKAFEEALASGKRLLAQYPNAEKKITRTAWLVVAHSSYEIQHFSQAEGAYLKVLALLPTNDKTRKGLIDNLAASIYKQGELANTEQDYRAAADHFLRVGRLAPTSTIRVNAEYDAAVALMQLKEWKSAAAVLVGFRTLFPQHPLQPEVTKKIAYVYKEDGQLSLAAREYERIETESEDDAVRRDALLVAADLYEKDAKRDSALKVYRRYVAYFPKPVDLHLETRNKIALILKFQNDQKAYFKELRQIVAIDAGAGKARTDRTRYLAGKAALVLAEATYERFTAVALVKPFKRNLKKKQKLMKQVIKAFNRLVDYELGEITAAATFYLAETYAHFSKALLSSERPTGLSALELEEYELAIEEQAYPFEEKAIEVHESNLKLIAHGIYNDWVDQSLQKLAVFMPARYAKSETSSRIVGSIEVYAFEIEQPAPSTTAATGANAPTPETANGTSATQNNASGQDPAAEPEETGEADAAGNAKADEPSEAGRNATSGSTGQAAETPVAMHEATKRGDQ
jgi:tetratricopeptide (TPR) repeat protein